MTPKSSVKFAQSRIERAERKQSEVTVQLICPDSSGSVQVADEMEVDPNQMLRVEVQYSPSASSIDSPAASTKYSQQRRPSAAVRVQDIEAELAGLDTLIGTEDPGSDIDEDFLNPEDIIFQEPRSASWQPALVEESLSEEIAMELRIRDQRDERALREVAQEDMLYFNWSTEPKQFKGVKETFTGVAGPTFPAEGLTPLQIFEKYFDPPIMDLIVRETNKYAEYLLATQTLKHHARMKSWKDIDVNDIWVFFSIIMLQSMVYNPVEREYWTPKSKHLAMGDFPNIMPLYKFLLIKSRLHFVDNLNLDQVGGDSKKLVKIQPIIDHLNEKFSSLYLPEQCIAIDESLLLWKGRLSFAQLISNKAASVGIKSYELCESRTGYLWKMIFYTGKPNKSGEPKDSDRTSDEPNGATSHIVYQLVRPLLNRGHILLMDNFYNSPLLSRTLKAQKTDTVGTLRINREFVPEMLKNKAKSEMRPGEVLFSVTEDLSIVLWRDTNVVSLISTYHKVEVAGKEKYEFYKYKPQVVLDYNISMGGIDKKDQLLQAFPVERVRNSVWYKKVFRRLVNVSILNSYVIFNHYRTNKISQRDFRLWLAEDILKKYKVTSQPRGEIVARKSLGHYPIKNKTGRARCKFCAKKKVDSRTPWMCEMCQVDLCIIGCFKNYHTAKFDTEPVNN
ncbi:hypothetical protein ABMA27_008755 [Loxostege sticticalis]|uniref:PiggyBac transposable element-derived protein domain-containing protein n=1 Tax=Loxostege sticticalis TaxID=481309 RepID=A0ABR3HCH8_LOXSC